MPGIDCPVCAAPLKEMVRNNVLIDVCMLCRGIWLDCGELEKLLATGAMGLSQKPVMDKILGAERSPGNEMV